MKNCFKVWSQSKFGAAKAKFKNIPNQISQFAKSFCFSNEKVSLNFLVTVKAVPHECVIRTGVP